MHFVRACLKLCMCNRDTTRPCTGGVWATCGIVVPVLVTDSVYQCIFLIAFQSLDKLQITYGHCDRMPTGCYD